MLKPAKRIPDWYVADWSPSSHTLALPAMTWRDCEQAIDRLGPTAALRQAAHDRLRQLRLSSARQSPMPTLQEIIMIAAALGDPGRVEPTVSAPVPVRKAEALPRWGFTDVEVAITYTFGEVPRALALHRYSQLLDCYGERRSGAEIMRTIFLMVLGLPVRCVRTPMLTLMPVQTARAA